MTLLRDLIRIPQSVGPADYVVNASESADLKNYVVTEQLVQATDEALELIRHGVTGGRSQAKFLHGSFGSGKSHFMTVLRELLAGNPDAREIRGLTKSVVESDSWLAGKKILTLSLHMLDADSTEQRLFEAYLKYCAVRHPGVSPAALHHSDGILNDAAALRRAMGDEAFFEALGGSGVQPGGNGNGLASYRAKTAGWAAQTFDTAASLPPGTEQRDALVSALTVTFFSASVRSGRFLDLDTGLAVMTRHAQSLGYDAIVVFLDEFILWLSNRITETAFVNTEGAKLNKLVESSDAARPIPLISFVAQQRLLTDFFGDKVAGTDRETIANIMRSAQGRLGTITLADTNLPEIVERRILKPLNDDAKKTIDAAFAAVRDNLDVWNVLLLGAQHNDAGIGSDATAFRRLYPFSPALVSTLVALSQALQRQRTAVKVLMELLVERRDTLRVNDLIGVAALFGPLVLRGELPDRPELKQRFQAARATYAKLRSRLLELHEVDEAKAATHHQFSLDDMLIRTVLLGALVPEVPALHNLTAQKLHALNFGSITSPIPGYERQVVLDRLRRISQKAGELMISDDPDPIVRANLTVVDYDRLIDLAPGSEESTGAVQRLIRDLVSDEIGLGAKDTLDDLVVPRVWRGRSHQVQVRFGNVRDRVTLPDSILLSQNDTWRIVIDYPMDEKGFTRSADIARIEELEKGSPTVFWIPLFVTNDVMNSVRTLSKINFLLSTGVGGNWLDNLAADWSAAEREQGRIYLEGRRQSLLSGLVSAIRQAYGVSKPGQDVDDDGEPILHTVSQAVRLSTPQGGTLDVAFHHLVGQLLAATYPGEPHLPDDEKPVTKADMAKVLLHAAAAAADPSRGTSVPSADQGAVRRIVNRLKLGMLSENRYALNLSTCWWSSTLTQRAATKGYDQEFPVSVLRGLLQERDTHWGFDRELENLIIAVVALEQGLAFFDGKARVEISLVSHVEDRYVLRRPDMPTPQEWGLAFGRAANILGIPLKEDLNPAVLRLGANGIRAKARQLLPDAEKLAGLLRANATWLGLEPVATHGRLVTADLCLRLVTDLAEPDVDDADVVRRLVEADLGDLDHATLGSSLEQARKVAGALEATNWGLLGIADDRNEPEFAAVLKRLRDVARRNQVAADLKAALGEAIAEITRLLKAGAPKVGTTPGTKTADGTAAGDDDARDSEAAAAPTTRMIQDLSELDSLLDELRQVVDGGRKIRLSWEVL